jgi:hypothetical protein
MEAISQPPTKMRGLIIATRQDKEKQNLCKFLSKHAFSFSYLYVVNLLASHVSCLPLIKVDTHFLLLSIM